MQRTFVITSNRELVSAVRPIIAGHLLTVGQPVELFADYYTPWGLLPEGSRGFVEYLDATDGTVWVLMEGIEPALLYWDNRLVLSPFDCEDLVGCIRLPVDKRTPCNKTIGPSPKGTPCACNP